MTNKAICLRTGCPLLTQPFPQALDRHRTDAGIAVELSSSRGMFVLHFPR